MSLSIPVCVGAGLVFDGGRLLITQRPPDSHMGGLWEFPGGKLESGETYPDCVRRELQEELGVEVSVGPMLAAIEHHYPDKHVRIQFYQCQLRRGNPEAIECADLAWVTRKELDEFVFPAADAGLLQEIKLRPDLWEA